MVVSRRLLLPVSLAASLLIAGPAHQAAAAEAASRTIIVNGEGEASAKPDSARLSACVVSQAPTAAAALNANTTAMNRVFAALRMAGIPENKIQTSNFSVQPQYAPFRQDNPQPQRIVGYQVSNQVAVIVDDLTKLGPTLDALVRSGANEVGGIAFFITNPKPLAERARDATVADAAAKARTLASAAGVNLSAVMTIQEGSSSRPVPMFAMARALAAEAGPPPVASGEETVTVNVTMTCAIQ
ncbi:MAG: DUF541 domain-containing protein [Alphaproteobacteria bacterium]|nr:DUF541 domain-containing protein [Alphaproteobacteria bacterium]